MRKLPLRIVAVVYLCVGLAASACAQLEESSETLATLDGQPITDNDLDIESKLMDLRQEAYQARIEALGSLIGQRLLEKEAKKGDLTVSQLLEQQAYSNLSDPGDAEIEAFYEKQESRINKPLEEIRPQIVEFLKNSKRQAARNTYIGSLRANSKVQILISPPRVSVEAGDSPRRGPKDAPVTIVEFSDFQCPYCRRVQPTLLTLLEKYPGKISLVYKDLPLRQIHPQAQTAAEAARCAGEEGKFWEYHDKLFAIPRISKDDFGKVAGELGLDSIKFAGCLDSRKHEPTIQADFEQAMAIGAQSTPVFYVNGIQLKGAQPVAAFSDVIEAELAANGGE